MKTPKHLRNIIIIIIVAGAIGGIGNYYMLPPGSHRNFTMERSIILGIIAAGVLPIFLKLISSNLLDFKNQHYKNYIILISFCLLTGVFADVFLQGMYRKVFHEFENKVALQNKKIQDERRKSGFLLYNIQNRPKRFTAMANRNGGIRSLAKNLGVGVKEARLYQEIIKASILVIRGTPTTEKKRHLNTLATKGLIKIQRFDNEMWLQKR